MIQLFIKSLKIHYLKFQKKKINKTTKHEKNLKINNPKYYWNTRKIMFIIQ